MAGTRKAYLGYFGVIAPYSLKIQTRCPGHILPLSGLSAEDYTTQCYDPLFSICVTETGFVYE